MYTLNDIKKFFNEHSSVLAECEFDKVFTDIYLYYKDSKLSYNYYFGKFKLMSSNNYVLEIRKCTGLEFYYDYDCNYVIPKSIDIETTIEHAFDYVKDNILWNELSFKLNSEYNAEYNKLMSDWEEKCKVASIYYEIKI